MRDNHDDAATACGDHSTAAPRGLSGTPMSWMLRLRYHLAGPAHGSVGRGAKTVRSLPPAQCFGDAIPRCRLALNGGSTQAMQIREYQSSSLTTFNSGYTKGPPPFLQERGSTTCIEPSLLAQPRWRSQWHHRRRRRSAGAHPPAAAGARAMPRPNGGDGSPLRRQRRQPLVRAPDDSNPLMNGLYP